MSCAWPRSTCSHEPGALLAAHQRVVGSPSTACLARLPLLDSSELAVTFLPVAAFRGTLFLAFFFPPADVGLGLLLRSNDSFFGLATFMSSRLTAQSIPLATRLR